MQSAWMDDLGARLAAEMRRHKVPGASLAVLTGDKVYLAAAGVADIETGCNVTKQTSFPIGSTTKAMTATLVMQSVERGRIDLDAPVQRYLPDFRLAGPSHGITVRHLLAHTSGIKGDFFIDVGDGDDALARYVTALRNVPTLYEPGRFYSYCNAGYAVLGRICEVVEQSVWDDLLRDRLFGPAGMDRSASRTVEAAALDAAAGYDRDGGELRPAVKSTRSSGPAGSTVIGTAEDLIRFARVHLLGGTTVLRDDTILAMQVPQVPVPGGYFADHWGLGWMLMRWNGVSQYGHDGSIAGTLSLFRVFPERQVAIALLCNASDGGAFVRAVAAGLFQELVGVDFPKPPMPVARSFDLGAYAGRYERYFARVDVVVDGEELVCRAYGLDPVSGALTSPDPAQVFRLRPCSTSVFVEVGTGRPPQSIVFLAFDDSGVPQFLFAGARAMKRVGG